jgi:hypothetical protein
MAKKKESLRNYTFSDAFLKQLADQLLANVRRDSEEFKLRGFDDRRQASIEELIKEFDEIPADDYLEGLKMTTTEAKDAAREAVEKQVRTIFVMAENVFGKATGKYKTFGNAYLTSLSDDQAVRNAKGVVKTARLYFQDLIVEGLTEDFLKILEKNILIFDDVIDTQIEAIRNRDIVVEERITKGNALYAELSKLCNTGKDIFYSMNEAKYNDYIIYNTPTGKLEVLPPPSDDNAL